MSSVAMPTRKLPKFRFRCPASSRKYEDVPAIVYEMPDAIFSLSADERDGRADVSSELCTLDAERYFVRCVLRLPIVESPQRTFDFGPWVEVSAADFARYAVHIQSSPRRLSTLPGQLANELPLFPRSLGIPVCFAYGRQAHDRPAITVIDADHLLAREQRSGISIDRVVDLVSTMKGFVMLVE